MLSKQSNIEYGGVIYSGENCNTEREECFLQFESIETSPATLYFAGNRADKGGNIMFGGCLSHCSQKSGEVVNLNNANDIFWNLVSLSPEDTSQSNFAEHPNRVVFCDNSSDSNKPICQEEHQVTVYRGGSFKVQLMVSGELCSPSFNIIRASVPARLGRGVEVRRGGSYQQANLYCEQHTYTLQGGPENASNFTIDVVLKN